MDSPVEYIAGLAGKMKKKEKQRGESFLVNPYHGTAVAGLIASEPYKLPCYFEKNYTSGLCDKAELTVSGIAQHVKLSSFLARRQPSDLEDSIEKLVNKADQLTDDEKKQVKIYRKQIPVKVILNFSFGSEDIENQKKQFLQSLKESYEKRKVSISPNNDEYLLLQWLTEYIDNGMNWVESKTDKARWNNMRRERETYQREIENALKEYDSALEHMTNIARDYILPKKDYFIAVVAAGNQGKKLEYDKAGLLVKINKDTNTEDDPIVGVSAGCGKDYKELCSWSNYSNTLVDILAPGENIPVIFPLKSADDKIVSMATYVNGTSFSAPIVTGTIALLAQCKPTSSSKDIKRAIFENAYKDQKLKPNVIDGRVLNIEKTIAAMCKRDMYARPEKPATTKHSENSDL